MKRGPTSDISHETIVAIFVATGKQTSIAASFGVSPATVCHIKSGNRHADITTPYRIAAQVNAALVSMACIGRAL